jgi:hypothetical protein
MSPDHVHLTYELDRRQRLRAHLGTWLGDWPGVILIVAVPALVVVLAVLRSPWFLVVLLLPPFFNNLPRFIGGLANALVVRSQRMDVVIEGDRIGCVFGQRREWLPLEEIIRVERFGNVWAILGSGVAIEIPVSEVDEPLIARMRAMSKKGRKV